MEIVSVHRDVSLTEAASLLPDPPHPLSPSPSVGKGDLEPPLHSWRGGWGWG